MGPCWRQSSDFFKMASSNEQHVCINFCIKLGKTATEIVLILEKAFGSVAMSWAMVFEWHRRFREDQTSTEDNERSGRSSSLRTYYSKAQISEILDQNRRKMLRERDKCRVWAFLWHMPANCCRRSSYEMSRCKIYPKTFEFRSEEKSHANLPRHEAVSS